MKMAGIRESEDAKRLEPSLVFVLEQLNAMTGKLPARDEVDLSMFPFEMSRDFPTPNVRAAECSLRRAHSQHEKGWLTDQELRQIEDVCTAALERFARIQRGA